MKTTKIGSFYETPCILQLLCCLEVRRFISLTSAFSCLFIFTRTSENKRGYATWSVCLSCVCWLDYSISYELIVICGGIGHGPVRKWWVWWRSRRTDRQTDRHHCFGKWFRIHQVSIDQRLFFFKLPWSFVYFTSHGRMITMNFAVLGRENKERETVKELGLFFVFSCCVARDAHNTIVNHSVVYLHCDTACNGRTFTVLSVSV